MTQLLTVEATAQALSVSQLTVRRMLAAGKLPPVRIGRRVLVRARDVEALIARSMAA